MGVHPQGLRGTSLTSLTPLKSLCEELDPALLIRRLKKEVAELKATSLHSGGVEGLGFRV